MSKPRTRFTDKHGRRVRVGDALRAVGVNEGLTGRVVELRSDPDDKPFVVEVLTGGVVGRRAYMDRSWSERIDDPNP